MSAPVYIYTQSDGYELASDRIMGRQVAGRGFMRAVIEDGARNPAQFLVPIPSEIGPLTRFAEAVAPGRLPPTIIASWDDGRLKSAGALSYFDVSKMVEATWRRRARGLSLSILGLTHSISDPLSRQWVGALARVPTRAHDALVCTSRAIRDAAEAMILGECEDIARRFGGTRPVDLPQMPIIPLGIDLVPIDPAAEAKARSHWRDKLGIGPDDLVALFFGRIAFHAKAHPLPMYVGLSEAAAASGRRVHLIQAGWFPNDDIGRAFRETAAALAPNITHHFLDGRDDSIRREIWFAADFFTSLSDTIEESFGLTPIEAMAAGLPVVLSDWDGYRDGVIKGVNGFLIPSSMPGPDHGAGAAIAQLLAEDQLDFDSYEGFASLATAIDVSRARAAYETLLTDADRRASMGSEARRHAHAHYGWHTILDQHRALWRDLDQLRATASVEPSQPPPLHQDPFTIFAGHASHKVTAQSIFKARRLDSAYVQSIVTQHMNVYGRDHVAPNPLTAQILARFEAQPIWSVSALEQAHPAATPAAIHLSLGWLAKMGLISLSE